MFRCFLCPHEGPHSVYSSDVSRDGIVMVAMHRLTGDAEYLERATALGDALRRWLEPYGLLNGGFEDGAASWTLFGETDLVASLKAYRIQRNWPEFLTHGT